MHDDFTQLGGAESLFATIASIYKNSPIYTSQVNWKKLPKSIDRERIQTSWLQKAPFGRVFFKAMLPFYPLAFESFNFDRFDLVISSTTRFAKSVITKPQTVHICYINSLPRFLWNKDAVGDYLPQWLLFFLQPLIGWLKRWDKIAATRADFYIANSKTVAARLKKIYDLPSEVIYPFADTEFFNLARLHNWSLKKKKYFLVVSRLTRWKRIDFAINACRNSGNSLIIVGEGPDSSRLRRLAGKGANIEFRGRVTRRELLELYQNSRALIVTQEEDFGIAAVESQACGKPVIAYKQGGVAETVLDGKTGVLFNKQTEQSLKDAIEAFSRVKWTESEIRKNSQRFSRENFKRSLKSFINSKSKLVSQP